MIETPAEPEVPVNPRPPETPAPATGEPLDAERALSFIEDIIDVLTFKRVGLVALLAVVFLVLFSVYENRTAIFGTLTKPKSGLAIDADAPSNWVLSETNKQGLMTLAKNTSVGFVIVSDVDLKKNRRASRFSYIDDPTIKLEPAAMAALSLPMPVFDYDAKNTEQMVSILSNEFRCDPYKSTIYYRHAPELATVFPTICRMAIPPFVGQFIGFLTVGIRGEVSKAELDSIRLEVSRLAVDIYLNDVMKKATPPQK